MLTHIMVCGIWKCFTGRNRGLVPEDVTNRDKPGEFPKTFTAVAIAISTIAVPLFEFTITKIHLGEIPEV